MQPISGYKKYSFLLLIETKIIVNYEFNLSIQFSMLRKIKTGIKDKLRKYKIFANVSLRSFKPLYLNVSIYCASAYSEFCLGFPRYHSQSQKVQFEVHVVPTAFLVRRFFCYFERLIQSFHYYLGSTEDQVVFCFFSLSQKEVRLSQVYICFGLSRSEW